MRASWGSGTISGPAHREPPDGETELTTAWSSLARLSHFAVVMARLAVTLGLGAVARRVPWIGSRLAPPPSAPQRLRVLLEALGGTFIKFGQVLALQPDILPRRYCEALFDLMERVPPFDYHGVERIFREELGQAPLEIFDSFEQIPVASASIAQVHVARLDGRKLAVKVQRPRARRDFGGDILLMKWTAAAIRRLCLARLYWLALALEEFVSWTGEELDFRIEARFMDRLAVNSRDCERERVPEVDWSLTSPRILTAEYLEGTTLLQYLRSLQEGRPELGRRLARTGFEPERFAENVLENFLNDVFHHGIFHADLHPANLLILPDNTVGYVDFGISGVLSEYARYHLVATVMALARCDTGKSCDHLLAVAELDADSDTRRFRRELDDLGEEWFRREPGGRRLEKTRSYTEIMLDTLRLSRRLRILPHPEAMRYMRSVITIDGLLARFAPDLDRDKTLERTSAELLEKTSASALFSFDRWVDWLWAGARLMRDGPSRLDRALEQLERRVGSRRRSGPRRQDRKRRSGARALQLGIAAVVAALLVVLFDEAPRLGLNLFTAELAMLTGALALLVRELFAWRSSRR
jgi:ubiquinone biosynthesis protein